MIKKIVLILAICVSQVYANMNKDTDTDFDGVPDFIDECAQTPFLNEVDKTGCTTYILTLPFETTKEHLDMTLGYGYASNEDLVAREEQKNIKLEVNYYNNNWLYSFQAGYYSDDLHKGAVDTIVRMKKRIKLNSKLILGLGGGLRLPTFDFEGNKLDAVFYSSLHYYPSMSLSFFVGYNYSYIGDDEIEPIVAEKPLVDKAKDTTTEYLYQGLQNIHKFYMGTGYFFTDKLYCNVVYSDESSKFVGKHHIRTVMTSMYYKINKKWFSTIYYNREVLDEDLHDTLLFRVGYHIW